jgi:hypothetical protein
MKLCWDWGSLQTKKILLKAEEHLERFGQAHIIRVELHKTGHQ